MQDGAFGFAFFTIAINGMMKNIIGKIVKTQTTKTELVWKRGAAEKTYKK